MIIVYFIGITLFIVHEMLSDVKSIVQINQKNPLQSPRVQEKRAGLCNGEVIENAVPYLISVLRNAAMDNPVKTAIKTTDMATTFSIMPISEAWLRL